MSAAIRQFYSFGDFMVDTDQKILLRRGKPLPLTPKVFDMLLILIENSGRIVEKEVLMNRLWPDTFVEESNLTFNIHLLRKALGDDTHHPQFIETVARRGYRFIAQARSASTLNHPNVCIIHKTGETDDGRPSIAMEHIEGVPLRQRMNESLGTDQLQASRLTTIGLPDIRRSRWPKRLALTGLILISITGLAAGIYKLTRRIDVVALLVPSVGEKLTSLLNFDESRAKAYRFASSADGRDYLYLLPPDLLPKKQSRSPVPTALNFSARATALEHCQ
jgi:DNA-binding winged helix-turn-helix (wHTH) protein